MVVHQRQTGGTDVQQRKLETGHLASCMGIKSECQGFRQVWWRPKCSVLLNFFSSPLYLTLYSPFLLLYLAYFSSVYRFHCSCKYSLPALAQISLILQFFFQYFYCCLLLTLSPFILPTSSSPCPSPSPF